MHLASIFYNPVQPESVQCFSKYSTQNWHLMFKFKPEGWNLTEESDFLHFPFGVVSSGGKF